MSYMATGCCVRLHLFVLVYLINCSVSAYIYFSLLAMNSSHENLAWWDIPLSTHHTVGMVAPKQLRNERCSETVAVSKVKNEFPKSLWQHGREFSEKKHKFKSNFITTLQRYYLFERKQEQLVEGNCVVMFFFYFIFLLCILYLYVYTKSELSG